MLLDVDHPVDSDIEALCLLMNIVGKRLDTVHGQFKRNTAMDAYIEKMRTLSKNKKVLSTRLRCLLKDVIEKRERKWVCRIEREVEPKKITEIRDEFERRLNTRSHHRLGRREKQGWHRKNPHSLKYKSHGMNGKSDLARSHSMPSSPSRTVPSSPGAMMGRSNIGRGTIGGLHAVRKHSSPHPVRKISGGGNNGALSCGNTPRGSVGGACGVRGINISSRNGRTPGWKKRTDIPRAKGRSMRDGSITVLKEEQIHKKVTNLIQEYYNCRDANEAVLCVTELDNALFGDKDAMSDVHTEIIYNAVFYAFERGAERYLTQCVELIDSFLDKNVISDQELKKGFCKVCSTFKDICLDIPSAPKHLAFILTGLLMKYHLSLSQICSMLSGITLKMKKRRMALDIALNTLTNINDKKEIVSIYKSCMSQGTVQCLVNLLPADNRSQTTLSNIIRQNKHLSMLIPHLDLKEQ